VRFDIAQGVTSRENFYGYNSISVFAESVCLFCFFVKMSRKNWHNKYVNRVSASALSIYLISAHPCLISNTWTKILNMTQYLHSLPVYYTLLFVFSIIIMAFCLAVDMLLGTVGGGVKKWWNLRKYHETK
jgi:surface polysaccharide O-acyltransferase-like enzyme